jgi:3,4-dihydroxy 2-butanone 4-phosphate synthase/GTP cyclohydrolase II
MEAPATYVDIGQSRDEMQQELARLRSEVHDLRASDAENKVTVQSLRAALEEVAAEREQPPVAPLAEQAVDRLVTARLPTEYGAFEVILFRSGSKHAKLDRDGEIALVYGGVENLKQAGRAGGDGALLRVHSSCFTGDVLGSHRCDCGEQLQSSLQSVAKHGCGVVIYLHQEGRGIGLLEKLKAYNLQDTGLDTLDANLTLGHPGDAREYSAAVAILRELGVEAVRLLTNNPHKVTEMQAAGINVVDRVPIIAERITKQNYKYLRTKAERMNHQLGARFLSGRTSPSEDTAALCKECPDDPTTVELPQDRPAVLYDNKPPFPVVAVNDLWLKTCGFQREEVLGKTMQLIQGPLTEGKEVGRLMDTIYLATMPPGDPDRSPKWAPPSAAMWTRGGTEEDSPPKSVSASLINYSKDRQAMRNDFEVVPVGAASEQLLSVSTFTPLDPAVQQSLESTAATATGSEAEDIRAVEACLEVFRTGGMVLVADDEERENEGDLIVAAELITEQQVDNTCIDLLTDSVSFFSSLRPLPPHCPMSRLTFECAVPCRWPSW